MASPSRASRRYVPPRATSVPEVLEAALRIADQEGLDALSMRRLAEDLGIGAMTLYRYVATKDVLLNELALLVLGNVEAHPDPATPWRSQLTAVITELHRKLEEHPGVTELILTRPLPTPGFDRYREAILGVLRRAGFELQEAVDALTLLACYVTAYAHLRRIRGEVDPAEETARLQQLPATEFPYLVEAATFYPKHLREQAFETGLRNMIDGLDHARRRSSPTATRRP